MNLFKLDESLKAMGIGTLEIDPDGSVLLWKDGVLTIEGPLLEKLELLAELTGKPFDLMVMDLIRDELKRLKGGGGQTLDQK